MNKYEIAQILRDMGFLIELTDDFPKKGLAYRKAASTIEALEDFEETLRKNDLESLPGIGPTLSKTISLLASRSNHPYYQKLSEKIPPTLFELKNVPGLGPRRIRELYEQLKITNLAELEDALQVGRTSELRGYGPAFVKRLLERIALLKNEGVTFLYPQALEIAQAIKIYLEDLNGVDYVEITGALRRKVEIINELEFVVISKSPKLSLQNFIKFDWVKEVLTRQNENVSVVLKQGIRATIHIVSKKQHPFSLLFYTGSKEHASDMEKIAVEKGYLLTPFDLKPLKKIKNPSIKTEGDIYKFFGLPFIPPEIRENTGEIEAAQADNLPHLIEEKDLKGVFHCHTIDSDGGNTLEQMVEAARKKGWEYIGISDHSKSSYQAHGLNEERLFEQIKKINALNDVLPSSFQVFSGIECDILKDGQLDFHDDVLKLLNFVIISIHRYFNMEEDLMTQRLIKAIENPYTTMVGHLTGRLLRLRNPYKLNVAKIIDACLANHKVIELNAYPNRLDMDWRYWQKAKEKGLKCSINPDAHSIRDLDNIRYGINVARKGWLEKNDVINTLSLKEMRAYLKSSNNGPNHRPIG